MMKDLIILHETADYLAIDKPCGISVHNDGVEQNNILDLLGGSLHLAHRLDKETSGVLLLAKSSGAAAALMKALDAKSTKKVYRAILRGVLNFKIEGPRKPENLSMSNEDFSAPQDIKTWTWPLTDKPEGRQNPQGRTADRLQAQTRFEKIRGNNYFTEIRAEILTGRQHQIRKHAAIAKHPVVGDQRYNDRNYNQKIFDLYNFERMLLHAASLEFIHREESIRIEAPLPSPFSNLIPTAD